MSITPKIHLVAFEDRSQEFIFVAVPDERGRYLRTDRSVAFVACPHCKATVGEPCRSSSGDGYSGTTHFVRRNANRQNWGKRAGDVLATVPTVPDAWMEAAA